MSIPFTAWQQSRDLNECVWASAAKAARGLLNGSAHWTAGSTAPERGLTGAGARVFGLVYVGSPAPKLTFTGTFTLPEGKVTATASGGAAGRVGLTLDVIQPSCDTDCYFTTTVLAAYAEPVGHDTRTGDQDVSVTLEAPPGEQLPAGRYVVGQGIYMAATGLRVPGATASASAEAIARGVTYKSG